MKIVKVNALITPPVVVCIVGPTASGKTQLAIELAKKFRTVILSADSRQFYRKMDIGTAKPTRQQLQEAQHFFVDDREITSFTSAGSYEKEALMVLNQLFEKYSVIIVVGGSGLYIEALINGLDDLPDTHEDLRKQLNKRVSDNQFHILQQMLMKHDPEYYKVVDLKNPQRIVRALEVCLLTGKPYSEFRKSKEQSRARSFRTLMIGTLLPREILYQNINQRVKTMFSMGLIDEVKNLVEFKHEYPLKTVGYKEVFEYLENTFSLEETLARIQKNTRNYAKRQITWFKRYPDIQWHNPEKVDEIYLHICNQIHNPT